MHIQLIDTNFEFQKVNPELTFTETVGSDRQCKEYHCSFGRKTNESISLTIFVRKSSKTPKKEIYNGTIRVGDCYQDFSQENKFQLSITDLTEDGIREVLNAKSKIMPTLTNCEVYDRLQKIKRIHNSGNTVCRAIPENDLEHVVDLLRLDYEVFVDNLDLLARRRLELLHNALFHKYGSDLFNPLCSQSIIDELDSNIEKIYKVAETMNYVKFAETSFLKFKTVISDQLSDINKLQDQMKALNEKNEKLNEKLKLSELDLASKKEASFQLEKRIQYVKNSNEDLREKYYLEEKNRIAIEKKYEKLEEKYQNLQEQMTTVQTNPTKFATNMRNTTCNDCLKNIQERVKAESKLQTLILSHKIHS
ncbi:MAG: hypothetical protein CMM93_04345 [Rickettsiales bacterium]|nr:hypothetical protein [Rickettsiales bacterium]|tara:strand:+ start:548 stop:1639 length:1092 start_codon:yes stop_codon:yes gene_type:complete